METFQTEKIKRYKSLSRQIKALIEGEPNLIANLANVSAAIFAEFEFHWVGFYLVEGDELVLAPFQGPVACTRIQKGKGVCGTTWENGETSIVKDVHQFPGHIACSALSNSEIVVPLFNRDREVIGVLDIDSTKFSDFDEIDQQYLELICQYLES